jgi:polyisoprenoid-binding protein YceI
MIIITAVFLIISGVFAAIAKARNNTKASEFIATYILGISTLILTKDYLVDEAGPNQTLVFLLIAILSVSFALGEFLKNKSQLAFLIIPVLLSGVLLLYPQLASHSYMGHQIDDIYVLTLIAFVSASAPIIIHLINKVIRFLVTKITPIQWSKTDSNLFEGALAFLFIGGMAALGGFLLGKIGILIAATFFLSTSFLSRNKTSISSGILISTSGALFLISVAFIVMQQAGYKSLDLTNGEVIEGLFIGGFIVLIYELIIKLAQQSEGKWKVILTIKAILVPLLIIFLLGFAYTQLERLGGVLTLTALLISIGVLSIIYSTFKSDSNIIGLKLFSLGFVLMIAPYFAPVKQTSGIDLGALGIEQSEGENDDIAQNQSYHEKLDEPNGKDLSNAIGNWKIDEEKSKIFFELGPPDGRTSGEFQKVTGNFNVSEDISNATIKVILPVKQISTYNSMRDESLMDIEYFHEEKYPELTFESKNFTKNGEAYEVEGMFTLLGISKPLGLTLKMVGVGEQDNKKVMVLWGKASLNRTDYGMPSSAKVGDVVDFHFEVQLTK